MICEGFSIYISCLDDENSGQSREGRWVDIAEKILRASDGRAGKQLGK